MSNPDQNPWGLWGPSPRSATGVSLKHKSKMVGDCYVFKFLRRSVNETSPSYLYKRKYSFMTSRILSSSSYRSASSARPKQPVKSGFILITEKLNLNLKMICSSKIEEKVSILGGFHKALCYGGSQKIRQYGR